MTGKKENAFVGYEYKEIVVPSEQASMRIDCYECFGWELDKNIASVQGRGYTTIVSCWRFRGLSDGFCPISFIRESPKRIPESYSR